MNKSLSLFLDLLRLGAALLVLVGHMAEVFALHLPDLIHHSAKEGVAIFFVLSGFVIAFVTDGREKDWRAYARSRYLRMVSVVPLALVVLCLCYAIGVRIDPAAYAPGPLALAGTVGDPPSLAGVLRYLTFTNELWFARGVISTGAPFWSLGFEMAYYVAFAILLFGRGWWRVAMMAAWAAVCGPRIVLAFPLWLIGVVAWHMVRRGVRLSPARGWLLVGLTALAVLAWRKFASAPAAPLFEWHAPGALALSMGYYAVLAVLIALLIVSFAATAPGQGFWPALVERAVRFLAGASFTLYIAHLPLMVLFAVLLPVSLGGAAKAAIATTLTILAVLLLAEVGERRKNTYATITYKLGQYVA
ncbi:acyltransferase family protein [Novosphingobium colocasiae]|uniref:Acyltransferase 3 domain-containing protein n=1 Tax=Novosphingobium colocasiae TaxID=1256513 RepID=A0A918PH79_9SPHN|nr:acyltransferase family protein [Novosphingobium colocasiae]GGZ09328.1 hypothetical protein GCM10011614_25210 [Novosphingobium colocasiae]